MSGQSQPIPRQTLARLPAYHSLLLALRESGLDHVAAPTIARALSLGEVQVRKDLAVASQSGGRPRTGFVLDELIASIERCLGYDQIDEAVLVGAGRLGRALLGYDGFDHCGVRIVAAFDSRAGDGERVGSKHIFPMARLEELCGRLGASIGIVAVPEAEAQGVCDRLVGAGVRAVWNFAPVHLNVPEGVLLKHENLAASLALLSQQLAEQRQYQSSS